MVKQSGGARHKAQLRNIENTEAKSRVLQNRGMQPHGMGITLSGEAVGGGGTQGKRCLVVRKAADYAQRGRQTEQCKEGMVKGRDLSVDRKY